MAGRALLMSAAALAVSNAQAVSASGDSARLKQLLETVHKSEAVQAAKAAGGDAAAAKAALGEVAALRLQMARERLHADKASGKLRDSLTVNTTYGPVVGLQGSDGPANMWLGVPFAAPPIGNLRWKAPQPPTSWIAPKLTQDWAPACYQSEWYWGLLSGVSEDCLYLNVYAPVGTPPPGGWPVMFFIYGGSWTYGSASFWILYGGNNDVGLTNDTIIVTINYRLNVFGFLAGDLLKAESPDGSVGNYGFQDQTAALKWVQANIASFGGDPTRVMLFGESAGGGSTTSHLVAPRSAGLFSRAGIESGSASDWTVQPYNISSQRLPKLLNNTGCAAASDPLACLRALNTTDIFKSQDGFIKGFQEWSPVIDGVEIPDDPRVLIAAGKAANVPVLLGFNKDEGTLFNNAPTDLNASDYVAAVARVVGPALAPTIAAGYPVTDYESPWWAISAMLTDSQMACPAKFTAGALTNSTTRPGAPPAFVYFYTHVFEIIDIVDIFKPLGCFHGSELVNVFDVELLTWGPGEVDLARLFVRYWTRFAATGDPNGASDPQWLPYGGANGDAIVVLDTGAAGVNVTMQNGIKDALCAFWSNITVPASVIYG